MSLRQGLVTILMVLLLVTTGASRAALRVAAQSHEVVPNVAPVFVLTVPGPPGPPGPAGPPGPPGKRETIIVYVTGTDPVRPPDTTPATSGPPESTTDPSPETSEASSLPPTDSVAVIPSTDDDEKPREKPTVVPPVTLPDTVPTPVTSTVPPTVTTTVTTVTEIVTTTTAATVTTPAPPTTPITQRPGHGNDECPEGMVSVKTDNPPVWVCVAITAP